MKIVEAKKNDFKGITSLYYQLYPKRGKPPLVKFRTPRLASKIFVSKEGAKVIGFILAIFISYSKSRFGYLEELIVDQKYRGRGVGSKLVKRALAWEKARRAEVVFCTTDSAVLFYEKLDFRRPKRNTWIQRAP
ncbi:GNAT family N-acetyltransferase [Candidatus Marsarchaeota archaeon]|jgi:predicted N-acetyltransferase YhbS|nr:GNAT family N-acetyltransferase [Candidatus Marsarchaeota archaeon]